MCFCVFLVVLERKECVCRTFVEERKPEKTLQVLGTLAGGHSCTAAWKKGNRVQSSSSGMALRGGRLRSCFSFSTPPRQRSKDLRTFLRFHLTSYLWTTCFQEYSKGVFRDQQNIKKPLLSPLSKGMTDSGFRLAFYNSPSINLIRYTSGFSRSSGKLHKSIYSLCSMS